MGNVRGVLFLACVRMLRSQVGVDWSQRLPAEDLPYLSAKIEVDAWYPMATFERMGNEILHLVARGELVAVQMWGRYLVAMLHGMYPSLIAPNEPVATIERFRSVSTTFFDYAPITVPALSDREASVVLRYEMGMPAEEAASHQAMGLFEALLELAGAREIRARLTQKSWLGDPQTRLELRWVPPAPVARSPS